MALIFLGVPIILPFKFRVATSQLALASSLIMSSSTPLKLNPLDYQLWEQCWSIIASCKKAKNNFQV